METSAAGKTSNVYRNEELSSYLQANSAAALSWPISPRRGRGRLGTLWQEWVRRPHASPCKREKLQARKRSGAGEALMVVTLAGLLTGLLFLGLYVLDHDVYLRVFFYRSWPIQSTTTYVFCATLALLLLKCRDLAVERKAFTGVAVKEMATITSDTARAWLARIPALHQDTLVFRRFSELFRAFLNGEDIVGFNEELARRDMEQVYRGYEFIGSLRELLPILGFLGTVWGLSMGMLKFPELMQKSDQLTDMTKVLVEFAGSLSVAFETTLLGLGYTIIAVIIISLLRKREEMFVAQVDTLARSLLPRMKPISPARDDTPCPAQSWEKLQTMLSAFLRDLSGVALKAVADAQAQNNGRNASLETLGQLMHADSMAIAGRLEAVQHSLSQPPHYEIRVSPINTKGA